MATMSDIDAQRDAALAILDDKILQARKQRNAGVPAAQEAQLDQAINDLSEQRQAVFDQAFERALDSDEMDKALAALRVATSEMNRVAAEMMTATTIINNLAALGSAVEKVTTALKG
jgi:t-SNARE complex subunit (syntaxin)